MSEDVSGEIRLIAAVLQQALSDSADGMRAFSKERRGAWNLANAELRMVELNAECAAARERIDELQAQIVEAGGDGPFKRQLEQWLKEERKDEEHARFRRVRHMVPLSGLRWLLDTNNAPMSARWICDMLGLNHDAVVEQIEFGSRQLASVKGPHNTRPVEVV